MKIVDTETNVELGNEIHFINEQFKKTLSANNIPEVGFKLPIARKEFEKFTMYTDKRPVVSSLSTVVNK